MGALLFRPLSRLSFAAFCIIGILVMDQQLAMSQTPVDSENAANSQIQPSEPDWKIIATSPGVSIVKEEFKNPGKVMTGGDLSPDIAMDWLSDRNLEEGRNFRKGKLLYVSVGTSAVRAQPSDPKFIDSRFLAFQRAELMAKAKTAIFLGTDLTTSRGTSEREINPEERAALEDIMNTSPTLQNNTKMMKVSESIYEFFEKAKTLASAKLDKAIENTGVDVSEVAEKKEAANVKKNKQVRLRNISEASMKASAAAFSEVQGTQIIQTFEGSYRGGYRVIVVTLWSQNMQKLVDSMISGNSPNCLTRKNAKAEVTKQLPEDPMQMAILAGVRSYINQDGENVLLAFGQSGVEIIGGREDMAYERAGKKARLRAMAAMRNFMGEKVAFQANEELAEVLALYADEYDGGNGDQDYKSISQFNEKIQAVSAKQRLTGLHGLVTRELAHPFTGKPMVIKVMAWSPSSQAMSKEIKQAIEYKPTQKQNMQVAEPAAKEKMETTIETGMRKGVVTGQGADEDAY
ncbi:hypothetical protein DSCO28_36570 [Desulfosarcina ovata subsp. sediminis]|uniref:DUF6844 domain-containing protein n=1 Tax=Desulfosarcina ovata subsp. sediminis TaxID=885957 RepID=A0A5K7ZSA9_9BACT|nr:hypothetical protein [Desulfosarcina ovata]BBO83091.1 hypothetical protein DSCO28_36570 [Desulfosarcina ovata subsp. sediminis]